MDALKFVRETSRMCKSFGGNCEDCPANDVSGCMVDQLYEEIVPIVEKWSKENQRKTRQDVFLEQWPETTPDEHGVMRWIPVTERLPETAGSYIVCTKSGSVAKVNFYPELGRFQRIFTHWMPLPEPPETDGGGEDG